MRRWLLVTLIVCAAWPVVAEPSAGSARDALAKARELSQTTRKWTDRTQRLRLKIVDRHGGERHREMAIWLKKYPEERTHTLVVFAAPPEVKGVGFLQWADPHAKDQQWLYVPELQRVRQISGGAKRESFAGTDFSYDDLAIMSQILDWTDGDAQAVLIRDETLDGHPCHVIEFTPTGKELTYAKVRVWLTADEFTIPRFEMLDASGAAEKELVLRDFRNVGAIPTAYHLEMKSDRNGSFTVVDLTELSYDSGLADDLFTQRSLERGL